MCDVIELIKNAGVVGAGGAGFPTHVKLNCRADLVIANGAECEPLLHVDQILMQIEAERIVQGLEIAMSVVHAKKGVIATKLHYHDSVGALKKAIAGRNHISLHLMKSYYPAGDEKSLIYDVTGRVVPNGKLPSDVNCVVSNIGTLVNIADALEGKPVIKKYLTIGGAVAAPATLCAPIGIALRELFGVVGFQGRIEDYALMIGGPCMGRLEENWDAPVTKTTGGILVFPRTHPIVVQQTRSLPQQIKLMQAVCCQCSQCTQLCPRNTLGLNVSPHKVMRSIANVDAGLLGDANSVLACSSCGLCTNYACNFGLSPSVMMAHMKAKITKAGIRPDMENQLKPDEAIVLKRVPTSRLISRMGLSHYDVPAPLLHKKVKIKHVTIPLLMHIGKAALPLVRVGDMVQSGDLIADIPEKSLGAKIHASINGKVVKVTDSCIEIKA